MWHLGRLTVVNRLCWLCVLMLLPLTGCDRSTLLSPFGYDRAKLLKKLTPPDDESLAINCIDLLLQGRYQEIEAYLDPSTRDSETPGVLATMASYFPTKPVSEKTVDVSFVRGRGSSSTNLTLEYEFPRGWLLAQFMIQTKDGAKTITGFHVTPISESVEVANEFTLYGKGFSQYTGLCLAVLVLTFTLYAFVSCAQAKIGKRKWLWLIVIVLGGCRLTLNWTTGLWFFTPLALQFPPVMMTSALYGPWLIQIVAPLGAIAFLAFRKRGSEIPSPVAEAATE